MKPKKLIRPFAFCAFIALVLQGHAATVTKSSTGTNLADGASWGGTSPTATDTATWSSTSLGTGLTLDSAASWQGIVVNGALTNVDISGLETLTLGAGGINLAGASTDLTLSNSTVLGSAQTWKATGGRTLTHSGAISGTGDITFGGAGASSTYNGYLSTNSGSPTTAFASTSLASITAVSGVIAGAWITTPTAANGYLLTNNGTTATVQLQFYDGTHTKVAKIQLSQSGADVVAYQVYAKYKTGNYLGQDFDVIAVDGTPPVGSGGYGVSSTTVTVGGATGTIALSGSNSYTGATTVNAGTLNLSGGSAIPNDSAVTLASGTNLLLNTSETIGSLAGAGNGNLQGNALTLGGDNGTTAHSGVLSGTGGSLVKTGTGTLTLSGANTYTGGTTVNGGTLEIGTGSGTAGTLPGTALVNASGTLNFNYGSNGVIYGGNLTGSGAVIVTGNNDLQLSGDNTGFSGTLTVDGSAAHLRARSANAINSSAALELTNGGAVSVFSYANSNNIAVGSLASSDATTYVRVGSNTNRGMTVGSNNQSTTFAGVIKNDAGGTGFLTKTGSGTLTLSGSNTYTGATTINGGTLALTGSATLSSPAITVGSGAFFDVSGLTGGFTLGGGKTLKGEGSVTGNITEDAAGIGVITAGNGTSGSLSISGSLTFNGPSDVNIGTLSNYTSAAAVAIDGDLTAPAASPGDILINLPAVIVAEGTYHLISHANALVDIDVFALGTQPLLSNRQVASLVNNPGSIDYVVSGSNPVWTGALDSSWTSATLSAPKNWTLPGGGTTDYIEGDVVTFDDTATGTTTVDLAMDVNPATAAFDHTSKNYTLQSTGGFGITTGGLTKTGTGVLTVTNVNTFTDSTILSAGTIRVGSDSALGGGNLILNGGTLSSDSTTARALANTGVSIGGDLVLGNTTDSGVVTLSAPVNLNAATRVLATASDVVIGGAITNGSLTKEGSGVLTFTGANSYAATTINQGTLNIGGGGVTGSAGTGTITNNAALVVEHSGTPTLAGAINGPGSLTVNGGGTVTLSGLNEFTGSTTINGSTLVLGMPQSYTTSHVGSLATINSGGTLRINNNFATGFAYGFPTSGIPADITINAGGTFDKNGKATYIKDLTMDGNAAVIGTGASAGDNLQLCGNLTATSTAAGAPSISGMNLVAGTYTNAGNTRTMDVIHGPGSTAVDDLTMGVTGQQTPGAAAHLIKSGNGTLKFTGVNTYAGTTTVSQGTLKGATSLGGPLDVQAGATVAPGDGIGTLAAKATTVAGTYACDVDATTSDVLAVTGNLDLPGSTLAVSGTPAAASYTIATYTGTLTGTFGGTPPTGYSLDYGTTGQIKLITNSGYSAWATANGTGQTIGEDHDNDGVANGVEFFIGGPNNTTGFTALPGIDGGSVTWTKHTGYNGTYGADFLIETSETLIGAWTPESVGGNVTQSGQNFTYTFPGGGPTKKFVRLKVTGP